NGSPGATCWRSRRRWADVAPQGRDSKSHARVLRLREFSFAELEMFKIVGRIALVMLSLATIGAANAQQSPDWINCQNAERKLAPATAIQGCDAVIASGREHGRNLAIAYYYRANAARDADDLARAIADYGEAIKVDASFAAAFIARGNLYRGT